MRQMAATTHRPLEDVIAQTIRGNLPPAMSNMHDEGYLVIEVWEQQVNIGYGGDGVQLKDRAIQRLQEAIEQP
jgi:hypothetical protein